MHVNKSFIPVFDRNHYFSDCFEKLHITNILNHKSTNIMSLFVRKPMNALLNEAQETGTHTLKRTLGAGGLVALGIGAIIGAGLFSITGMAAANHAGPAITISFVVAGWVVFLPVYVMQNLHHDPCCRKCLYLFLCNHG